MAVKLTSGKPKFSSLTSPPEKPEPEPAEELIAKVMEYEDRKILVTVPFPDSIELVTDVFNHHQLAPFKGGPAKLLFADIDDELMKWVKGLKSGEEAYQPGPSIKLGDKAQATFFIPYDPIQPLHRARLTVTRRQGPDYPIWKVRFEFSASKAGPAGLVKLIAGLNDALPLKIEALLGSFQVSRVDPAIDLIGANPLDLIGHVAKPGKRLVYVGAHGRPESVYLYEAKKKPKEPPKSLTYNTRGPLRLKLYERRDYFRQLMLAPPYGNSPVTRAEVELRWKVNRPYFHDLANIKNGLLNRRVSYAAAVLETGSQASRDDWIQYCLAAFGGGASTAQSKWSLGQGLKFEALYRKCGGDLVNEAMWSRWDDGIASTGLDTWVEMAKANICKDVYLSSPE